MTRTSLAFRLPRWPLAALFAGVLAGPTVASGSAGGARPDPAFGGGRGWVTTPIRGTSGVAYAAIPGAGGRIVVAGQTNTTKGNGQILVARYLRSGRLDPGFGSRGVFRTALPASKGPFIAQALAPQGSSGKLLIAGGYGQGSMLLMRLTANGRLDRSFGPHHNGMVITPAGGIAQSVVAQRNGGILLGGSNANLNGRPMVVARFTRSGLPDRRFGHRGLATVLFWNPDLASSAGVTGLAPTSDGGAVASSHLDYIGSDGHGSTGVFKLSSSGKLVPSFGTAGHVEIAFNKPNGAFAQWFPCALTIDRRGRVSETGDGSTGNGAAILTTRLTPRGALDSTFGTGGRSVIQGLPNDSQTTCGASVNASGTLTVGVGATVAQLRPNGTPDSGFAPRGKLTITRPRRVSINAVVRTGAHSITVAGFAGTSAYVARYRVP